MIRSLASVCSSSVRIASVCLSVLFAGCSTNPVPGLPDGAVLTPGLQLPPEILGETTVGVEYSRELKVEGGTAPLTFAATGLPNGIAIDPSTGKVAGKATVAGSFTVEITVTDGGGQSGTAKLPFKVFEAPAIKTDKLPDATAGTIYLQRLDIAGGKEPLLVTIIAGELPVELKLDSTIRTLSGTPTKAGKVGFTLSVKDAHGATATRPLEFTVHPKLVISPTSLPAGEVTLAYSVAIKTEGGKAPVSTTVDGLTPTGLTYDKAKGAISGTPKADGKFPVTIEATDANGSKVRVTSSIEVVKTLALKTAALPDGYTGSVYTYALSVEEGKAPFTFKSTGTLPAGFAFDETTGTLSGTPVAAAASTVSVSVTDALGASVAKTFPLTVYPRLAITATPLPIGEVTVTYSADIKVEGGKPTVKVSVDGLDPTGLTFDAATGKIAGAPKADGKFPLTVEAVDANGVKAKVTMDLEIVKALFLKTAKLPDGYTGGAYSQTIVAAAGSGPYAFKSTGTLPAGLSLDAVTGVLSGKPSVTGASVVSVAVADAVGGSASKSYPFAVFDPPAIATETLPVANATVPYALQIQSTGGKAPIVFTVASGALPAGLKLDSSGLVSGTPTAGGTFQFTVAATDANAVSGSKGFTVVVGAGKSPKVATRALPLGVVGQPYSATLAVSDGSPPFAWTLAGGALPAGLKLSAQGGLTGNPTTAGTSTFDVLVTDAVKQTAKASLTIDVHEPLLLSTTSLPEGYVGQAYGTSMRATGGQLPYTWTIEAGVLPAGITLSSSGSLGGAPRTAGSYGLTVQVADASGQTADSAFTLAIYSIPTISNLSLADAAVGGAYSQKLSVTGGKAPFAFSVTGGTLPAGLSLAATGTITGTPTVGGVADFTVTVTDANGKTGTKDFALAVFQGLVVTTGSVADGYVGMSFNDQLSSSGGKAPIVWSMASGSLPSGLSLSAAGALSGTPSLAGATTFTVQVKDGNAQTATKQLRISTFVRPRFVTSSLPDGTTGAAYTHNVLVSGGKAPIDFSVEVGTLPAGIALSSAGVVSGTPTKVETTLVTVSAKDANGVPDTATFKLTVFAPVTILSTAAPDGYLGAAYTLQLVGGGGKAPVEWSVSQGGLHAGLKLDSKTGFVSGTPTEGGTQQLTFTVTDANGTSASKQLTISVYGLPVVATESLPDGTLNQAYTANLAATGGKLPLKWKVAVGALPAGLTLDASVGTLTGSPSASGTSNLTLEVADANGRTASKALSISVYASLTIGTATLESAYATVQYSVNISASGGKKPYSWALTSGSLPAGVSLSSTGALTGTPAGAGSSTFSATVTDGNGNTVSKSFTLVVVGKPVLITLELPDGYIGATYSRSVKGQAGKAPYAFGVSTGTLPKGIDLDSATGAVSGIPSVAGSSTFDISLTDANGVVAKRTFTIGVFAAPGVATKTIKDGYVGVADMQTLKGSDGKPPYTWTLAGGALPAGLSLAATGEVAGKPTAVGKSTFAVKLVDANGKEATSTFEMEVYTTPSLTTASFPDAYVGTAYSVTLAAAGGKTPYVFGVAAGKLPAGLSVSTSGAATGMPSAAGPVIVTVGVQDANGTVAVKELTLTVFAPPAVTTASLSDAYVGTAYSATLNGTGGKSPYIFATASGALPAGISLSSAGVLSGTPTTVGSASFTISLTDANAVTVTRALNLLVRDAVAISTASLPDGYLGRAYPSASVAATGGKAPFAFAVSAGTLAQGLTLSPTGVLYGTTSQVGTATFTVTATDANGVSASKAFSIAVFALPVVTSTTLTDGYVGSSYAFTLTVAGGKAPFVWSVVSGALPLGLTVSAGGAIAGTPLQLESASFRIRVTDANGLVDGQDETIAVHNALAVKTVSLKDGYETAAYTAALSATGGKPPYAWTLNTGTLPLGLSLSSGGSITGAPTAAGKSSFTVGVADANGVKASQALTLEVFTLPAISTASLLDAYRGAPYTASLAATGGKAPYRFVVSAGSLPAGLTLSAAGVVSGTPTATGNATFTITVSDANAQTNAKDLTIVVRAPVVVTTATLPDAYQGKAYSQTFNAGGGLAPFTWSVSSGSLPAGLTLDGASGTLSGTPTATGTASFAITATDKNGATGVRSFTLQIYAVPSVTSAAALPDGYVNALYSFTLASTGGDGRAAWTLVAPDVLPVGLSLSLGGVISGRPSGLPVTSHAFTVQIKDGNGETATKALTLTILEGFFIATSAIKDGYVGAAFSQTLASIGGTLPHSWSLPTGSTLPPVLSLSSTGDLTGTPTTAGTYTYSVKATDGGGTPKTKTFTQNILVKPSVTTASLPDGYKTVAYNQNLAGADGKKPYRWSITSGGLPPGLSLTASTGSISGTPTGAGATFTVTITDANGEAATASLTINVYAVPSLGTGGPEEGYVGAAYAHTLSVTDGKAPITFAVTAGALPAGVSLDAATGRITGTPTKAEVTTPTITATDANNVTARATYTVTVYDPPKVTTPALATAYLAVPYAATNTATGGKAPLAWSLATGTLPAGLSLEADTGRMTGTATAPGTSTFTVKVTDANGVTDSLERSITVAPALAITTATLRDGYKGSTYTDRVAAAGGKAPYSFSIVTGTLPSGVSLSTTGDLSGTPVARGDSNFVAQVTDDNGTTSTRALAIKVYDPPAIVTAGFDDAYRGSAYSALLSGIGGKAPFTWSVSAGALPKGVTLEQSPASLTGTVDAAAAGGSFTLSLSDANGVTVSKAFTMTVFDVASITTATLPDNYLTEAYTAALSATGGKTPLAWSVSSGALPAGLSLDGTGAITGTNTLAPGEASFTAEVKDANGVTSTKALKITAYALPAFATPSGMVSATEGVDYSQQFTATGGKSPLAYSAAGLPGGLTISGAALDVGQVTGVPAQGSSGVHSVVVTIADANSRQIRKTFSLTVVDPTPIYGGGTAHGAVRDGMSVFVLADGQIPMEKMGVRVRKNGAEYSSVKEALTNFRGKAFLSGLGGAPGDTFDVTVNGPGISNTTYAGFNAAVISVSANAFAIPGVRDDAQATYDEVRKKLVLFGGESSLPSKVGLPAPSATAPNDTLILDDSTTGKWSEAVPRGMMGSPQPSVSGGLTHVGGVDFLFTPTSSAASFDPATARWTPRAAWGITTPLPARLWGHGSAAENGYVYIVGGQDLIGNIYIGNPGARGLLASWSTAAEKLRTPRHSHGVAIAGGHLYVVGGMSAAGQVKTVEYAKLSATDGTLEAFRLANDLPSPRHGMAIAVVGPELCVAGGIGTASTPIDDVQCAEIRALGDLGPWFPRASLPAPRAFATLAAGRAEVYLLGGVDGTSTPRREVYAIPASGPGTWNFAGEFAVPRSGHASAVVNGTLFVAGGRSLSGNLDDVVVARLPASGGTLLAFENLDPFGGTARNAHTLAASGDYLYLAGGIDGTTLFSEVRRITIPPSPRNGFSLVTESASTALLFGGQGPGGVYDELWRYESTEERWNLVQPRSSTRPAARTGHGAAYDSARARLVVFGGLDGTGAGARALGDTWEFRPTGVTWEEVFTATSPPARYETRMTYDSRAGLVTLFGGVDGISWTPTNDLWTWSGAAWRNSTANGASGSPPPRHRHAVAFDTSAGHLVVFGGRGSVSALSDLWTYTGTGWVRRSAVPPSMRPRARISGTISNAASGAGSAVTVYGSSSSGIRSEVRLATPAGVGSYSFEVPIGDTVMVSALNVDSAKAFPNSLANHVEQTVSVPVTADTTLNLSFPPVAPSKNSVNGSIGYPTGWSALFAFAAPTTMRTGFAPFHHGNGEVQMTGVTAYNASQFSRPSGASLDLHFVAEDNTGACEMSQLFVHDTLTGTFNVAIPSGAGAMSPGAVECSLATSPVPTLAEGPKTFTTATGTAAYQLLSGPWGFGADWEYVGKTASGSQTVTLPAASTLASSRPMPANQVVGWSVASVAANGVNLNSARFDLVRWDSHTTSGGRVYIRQ